MDPLGSVALPPIDMEPPGRWVQDHFPSTGTGSLSGSLLLGGRAICFVLAVSQLTGLPATSCSTQFKWGVVVDSWVLATWK